ncbi:MAG: phosphatase PAP2 family protein, partial [Bdellovibrionota bacterium]
AIRWWLLAALAGVFALTISKNPDSRATALDGLRAIFPLFLMTCLYPLAPILIRAAGAPDRDAQLQWLDSAIFLGHDPLLIAERWISPALSEWMTLSYTAYGLIFLAVFAMLFVKKDLQPFAKLIFATTLALALGYLGYTLVPAVGPMFARTFSTPVDLHYLKELKESLIDRTRIERDCFPSLHTAITLIAASFAWRNLKPLFWILAPFAVTVPLACVYLRYHYVVDVLAGIALAAFAIVTSERVLRKSEARASRSR